MNTRMILRSLQGLAGLGLVLALAGCGSRGAATADGHGDPSVVLGPSDIAQVSVADLTEGVSVSGNLAPAMDARLISPFKDVIEQVLVKEGQHVAKGQVLARFRAGAIGPSAASAEAQRRVAESDVQRMKNLVEAGAVSKRDLESAQSALEAATANAALANERLADVTVRAPFAGVVAERHVKAGDRVGDGDPLFRVVNTAELEFEATVTAEHAASLAPGTPVALSVSGIPDGSISGRISRINATADPSTRQVRVYVTVPNKDRRLVGDQFASGRVVLREVRQAIAVPPAAIQTAAAGGSQVWVVENGKLAVRAVTLGLRDESQNLVQVQGPLSTGDTVVVASADGLTAGRSVQLPSQGK
ncbi:MAG TPA: efflux RND transporter periplasmic adaptor subunit [Candidatus Eisenbacteria bacterium]|nr:efflux RND transporter periplasmic adaptor subunit [Candidatus Eisenbacteria bacterium]